MEYKIEPYGALPCELQVFTINGKNADYEDFGVKIMRDGSCMDNECGCEFHSELPSSEVLAKYEITVDEYAEIARKLESELRLYNCGWCS